MDRHRIGIIGLGHLGSKHLKVYHELKDEIDLEIAGICDINNDRAQTLAKEYNVPFCSDYKDLKGKVDAVNICVPTSLHSEVGQFFLKNKVHTFIEKPITLNLKEADRLIALAEKNKLKLQVGHVERFNSAFEAIKPIVENPLFIECHRLNLFPNRSLDIGVVMDLMIHDIDIVLGLISSPLVNIQAVGVHVLTPLEDIANVRLTFASGCVCNLTASRVSDDTMRKIRIFQKDTYISLDYVKQEAFVYKRDGLQIRKNSLPIEKEEPLKKEIKHFITSVIYDRTPLISGREAREALKVALKISQKIWDFLKHQKI